MKKTIALFGALMLCSCGSMLALQQDEDSRLAQSDHSGMGDENHTMAEAEPLVYCSDQSQFFMVYFGINRVDLSDEDLSRLRQTVADSQLNHCDLAGVKITGYTDSSGNVAYNRRLSERRAESVRAALVVAGIDRSMIEINAAGEEETSGADTDLSRRAEVHIRVE